MNKAAQWLSRVDWDSCQDPAIKEKVQETLTEAKDSVFIIPNDYNFGINLPGLIGRLSAQNITFVGPRTFDPEIRECMKCNLQYEKFHGFVVRDGVLPLSCFIANEMHGFVVRQGTYLEFDDKKIAAAIKNLVFETPLFEKKIFKLQTTSTFDESIRVVKVSGVGQDASYGQFNDAVLEAWGKIAHIPDWEYVTNSALFKYRMTFPEGTFYIKFYEAEGLWDWEFSPEEDVLLEHRSCKVGSLEEARASIIEYYMKLKRMGEKQC